MNYWLVKSEPTTYSWSQLVKDGGTKWEGVRNYAARIHLNAMRKGDSVFFYHSNKGLEIVGVAKVVKEAYPDASADDPAWVAVDIKPLKALKNPVTLKQIKEDRNLQNMALLRLSRLSVQPVTAEEWVRVLHLAGT